MSSFALYRFPHEQRVTLVEQQGEPLELSSCRDLSGRQGFVVAPFAADAYHPVVLIVPDKVQTFEDASLCRLPDDWEFGRSKPGVWTLQTSALDGSKPRNGIANALDGSSPTRETYGDDFRRFHRELSGGRFRKLVLSRCAEEPLLGKIGGDRKVGGDHDVLTLFRRACQKYSRLFVVLSYTPKSGLWLTATPEILLEGEGSRWRTIALAGTMRLEGEQLSGEGEQVCWSTKNIQEQRYVATYIMDCLERLADDIREEGPRTVRAANLVHLRSDFSFVLREGVDVGDALTMLHPTPAVCGLPKEEAFRFILNNEHSPRRYYSGFTGPLSIDGSTHLYVSLRCMQIIPDRFLLYAGGGLLDASVEEQEWQETEAKLETMRALITL